MGKARSTPSPEAVSRADVASVRAVDAAVAVGALAAAGVGVWRWFVASGHVDWSPEVEAIFGVPPGTFGGSLDAYRQALHDDDRPVVEAALQTYLERVKSDPSLAYHIEHRIKRPDGSIGWVDCRGRLLPGAERESASMAGTVLDISARKSAEAALRASEERDRNFSELATAYMYEYDASQPALVPNLVMGAFERTTKLTLEAVRARGGWREIIHPDDREAMMAAWSRLLAGQRVVTEYRIVDGEGETRWLRDSARPICDASTRVSKIVGGVEDITEEKRLEQQLVHARKLEALARLAGGVAHDYNNLLMLGYTALDFLHGEAHLLTEEGRGALEDLAYATQRSAEVTRSLLAFGRRQVDNPRVVDVVATLNEMTKVLSRTAGSKVELVLETIGHVLPVRVDPGQLQLVLLNLVLNARDAMPDGGEIRIHAERCKLESHDSSRPGELSPGEYIAIAVIDRGIGMDSTVQQRLFEPFFTTKKPDGNGMGLATSHGIIRQAGGAFAVTSAPGKGSVFKLYLPLVGDAEVDAASTPGGLVKVKVGGSETILVVDDEPSVRRFIVGALLGRGYMVFEAESAESALEVLATEHERVDLLLTDVQLPRLDGRSLAAQFLAGREGRRALLISGFLIEESLRDLARAGTFAVLAKPFTSEGLAARVREVLDSVGERPTATK